ncbi:uncharacterized protein LOC107981582 [Nasonia vitripennis]|uniref:Uncharacterized protein n=1 Tax=Nasonia vitripennis TaxID=7425 RepID=A0A7M7J6B4_NASVI|nr:uncharacterized protein LOC107981582 [Nasonia vitripennis]
MSQLPSFRGPSLSPIPAVRRPGPRSKTVNTIQRPPLQDRTNRPVDNVGDVSQATASNHEAAESAFAMLREYKPKLFKKYVKAGYDVQSEIHETHERYEIVNDKVYLGLNVDVGQKTWRMINRQRKSRFLRDLGAVLWTKKTLANRCLDISKTKEKQLNGQPIQLLSPRKLDLYLSLYNDYLNKSRYYAHLNVDNKNILIKNSTESLSFHIRDEKKAQSCIE